MSDDTDVSAGLPAEDRAPELVPLNAIFATDFVQILVPVTTANTMREGRRRGRLPRRGAPGAGPCPTRRWSSTTASGSRMR